MRADGFHECRLFSKLLFDLTEEGGGQHLTGFISGTLIGKLIQFQGFTATNIGRGPTLEISSYSKYLEPVARTKLIMSRGTFGRTQAEPQGTWAITCGSNIAHDA